MKLKALVVKIVEVETANPIFEKLVAIHNKGDIETDKQYEEACAVIEGLTGYPVYDPGTGFKEYITAVTTNDDEVIMEA